MFTSRHTQKRSLHITDILFPRIEKSKNVTSDSSECLWKLILGAFGPTMYILNTLTAIMNHLSSKTETLDFELVFLINSKLTYVILVIRISFVHHLEQLHFNLRLIQEGLLVLDDLNGDMA